MLRKRLDKIVFIDGRAGLRPRQAGIHVRIEPATTGDIEEIVAIENRSYRFPWSQKVLLHEIKQSIEIKLVVTKTCKSGDKWSILDKEQFFIG